MILVISACDKQGYKEITETDAVGFLKGSSDPTDWGEDEKWKNKIEDLIGEECTTEGIGTANTVNIHPAFPNPGINGQSTFVFETTDTCRVRLMLTDKRTVYFRHCFESYGTSHVFMFDVNELSLGLGGYYRLYYDFTDAGGNVFYKGHGDILFE